MNVTEVEYSCSECQATVNEDDIICPKCGADLREVEYVEEAFSEQYLIKGIEGWLALFCFLLTFVHPVIYIIIVVNIFNFLSETAKTLPDFIQIILTFTVLITLYLAVYSFLSGYWLYKIKENAVQKAKLFLKISTIVNLVFFQLPLLLVIDTIQLIIPIIQQLVFFIVWYKYLDNSERVKNTYFNKNNLVEETLLNHSKGFQDNEQTKDVNYYDDSQEDANARILGIGDSRDPQQIKSKYLEQIKLYHPDKVGHLGKELQVVAEKRTKDINKAFIYFKQKYNIQ